MPTSCLETVSFRHLEHDYASRLYGHLNEPEEFNPFKSSLFFMAPNSKARAMVVKIVDSVYFRNTILAFILSNLVAVVLDDPLLDSYTTLNEVLDALDYLFFTVFFIEMVCKVSAKGFFLHRSSYLRSAWNVLDLFIVVTSAMELFLQIQSSLDVLRVIRIFRLLRTFTAVPGLRKIIGGVAASIPNLMNVFLVILLLLWIFACLGLQVWNGVLHQRCYGVGLNGSSFLIQNDSQVCSLHSETVGRSCGDNGYTGPQDCHVDTSLYQRSPFNFDNIFRSGMVTLKVATLDDWPDNLNDAQMSSGWGSWIFFMCLIMFIRYVAINLLLAVLTETFSNDDTKSFFVADLPWRNKVTPSVVLGSSLICLQARVAMPVPFEYPAEIVEDKAESSTSDVTISDIDIFARSRLSISGVKALPTDEEMKAAQEAKKHNQEDDNRSLDQQVDGEGDDKVEENDHKDKKEAEKASSPRQVMKQFPVWACFMLWRARLRFIVEHLYTQIIVSILIFINAGLMSADHYGAPSWIADVIDQANYVISVMFIVECGIKLFGIGFVRYFSDAFNVFDFTMVCLGLPDVIVQGGSSWSALRAFRLLALLKLARGWANLNRLIRAVLGAFNSAGYVFFLLLIFILIGGLIANNVFPGPVEGYQLTFNNLPESMMTVFIVVSGEGWASIMKAIMVRKHDAVCIFFIFMFVVGNYIIINLYVAALIAVLNETESVEEIAEEHIARQQEITTELNQVEADAAAAITNPENSVGNLEIVAPTKALPEGEQPQKDEFETDSVVTVDDWMTGSQHDSVFETAPGVQANGPLTPRTVKKALKYLEEPQEVPESPTNKTGNPVVDSFNKLMTSLSHNVRVEFRQYVAQHNPNSLALHEIDRWQHNSPHISPGLKPTAEKALPDVEGIDLGQTMDDIDTVKKKKTAGIDAVAKSMQREGKDKQEFAPFEKPPPGLAIFVAITMLVRRIQRKKDEKVLVEKSLYMFEPDNKFRLFCSAIVQNNYYDFCVTMMVFCSLTILFLQNPEWSNSNPHARNLFIITDYIFSYVFLIDVVLKLITYGALAPEVGYFRDTYNCVDAFITLTSVIAAHGVTQLFAFRPFRIVRLCEVSPEIRVILSALFRALPALGSVCFLCFSVWWVFAILGVAFYQGAFYHCTNDEITEQRFCNTTFLKSGTDAFGNTTYENQTAQWVSHDTFGFDNIFDAIDTLAKIALGDTWTTAFFLGINSRGPGLAPQSKPVPWRDVLYFLSFVIVGQYFTVNLFVAVLIDNFVRLRNEQTGAASLTDSQKAWLVAQRVLFRARLLAPLEPPEQWLRKKIFDIVKHMYFTRVINGTIIVNAIVLSAVQYKQNSSADIGLEVMNTLCIIIFTLEALAKITAYGPNRYFRRNWNRFDFFVVFTGWIGQFADGPAADAAMVVRVCRLLRLIDITEGVRDVFHAILYSVPSLLNSGLVVGAVFYIYAVLGVSMCAMEKPDDPFFNFNSVWYALVTLTILSTGEKWIDAMHACSKMDAVASPIYFYTFMLICAMILINLFVTVLLDNYSDSMRAQSQRSLYSSFNEFKHLWLRFDKKATGYLPAKTCLRVIESLSFPLWTKPEKKSHAFVTTLRQLRDMYVPLNSSQDVAYNYCLAAVSTRVFAINLEEAFVASGSAEHIDTFKKTYYQIVHWYAVKRIQKWWKGLAAMLEKQRLERELRRLNQQFETYKRVMERKMLSVQEQQTAIVQASAELTAFLSKKLIDTRREFGQLVINVRDHQEVEREDYVEVNTTDAQPVSLPTNRPVMGTVRNPIAMHNPPLSSLPPESFNPMPARNVSAAARPSPQPVHQQQHHYRKGSIPPIDLFEGADTVDQDIWDSVAFDTLEPANDQFQTINNMGSPDAAFITVSPKTASISSPKKKGVTNNNKPPTSVPNQPVFLTATNVRPKETVNPPLSPPPQNVPVVSWEQIAEEVNVFDVDNMEEVNEVNFDQTESNREDSVIQLDIPAAELVQVESLASKYRDPSPTSINVGPVVVEADKPKFFPIPREDSLPGVTLQGYPKRPPMKASATSKAKMQPYQNPNWDEVNL